MRVVVIIISSLIFSILVDTLLLEGKKDIKVIFKRLKEDKKYLIKTILLLLIMNVMAVIMKHALYTSLMLMVLAVLYKIVEIDFEYKVINIKLYIVLCVLSLLSLFVEHGVNLPNALLTGILSFLTFWGVSKATKEAFGFGDAMIIGALGVIFGFQGLCGILLVASLLSTLVSIVYLIKSMKNKGKAMAFTPFIYAAILILLFMNNY